jgi:hypothetical protein
MFRYLTTVLYTTHLVLLRPFLWDSSSWGCARLHLSRAIQPTPILPCQQLSDSTSPVPFFPFVRLSQTRVGIASWASMLLPQLSWFVPFVDLDMHQRFPLKFIVFGNCLPILFLRGFTFMILLHPRECHLHQLPYELSILIRRLIHQASPYLLLSCIVV